MCNKCNKCSNYWDNCKCNRPILCGCDYNLETKCVTYTGKCLPYLEACNPENLENILRKIDSMFEDIFNALDGYEYAVINSLGNGVPVLKKSEKGYSELRSLKQTKSVQLDITQDGNEITVQVNEKWLEGFIKNVVDEILDSDLKSKVIDIVINSDEISDYIVDIIRSEIDSLNIENLISKIVDAKLEKFRIKIVNKGKGHSIFKGFNESNKEYELRTVNIKSDSLINTVEFDSEGGLIFKIENPKIEKDGVKAYYVNKNYTKDDSDGSIIRPYKNWEECRSKIIGKGSKWKPENYNARVIFQTDLKISEDLSVNTVFYSSDSNVKITYTGNNDYVIDTHDMVEQMRSEITANNYNSQVQSVRINLENGLEITRTYGDKNGIIRSEGFYNDTMNANKSTIYDVNGIKPFSRLIISGNVIISEAIPDVTSNPNKFKKAFIDSSETSVYKNNSGRDVYVVNEINRSPLIDIINKNYKVDDNVTIDSNSSLTINCINSIPIKIDDSLLVGSSNATIKIFFNTEILPYKNIVNYNGKNIYLHNEDMTAIDINSNGTYCSIIGQSNLQILIDGWGVPLVGGIDSYIRVNSKKQTDSRPIVVDANVFKANGINTKHFIRLFYENSNMSLNSDVLIRINDIIYHRKPFIDNTYDSSSNPLTFVRTNKLINDSERFLTSLKQGELDTIFNENMVTDQGNLEQIIRTYGVIIGGKYNFNQVPTYNNRQQAIDAGLIKGTFYRIREEEEDKGLLGII